MPLITRVAVLSFVAPIAIMMATPVSAQSFLTGDWANFYHEDQPERGPGPALGDYTGLPLNAAARQYADSWDASRLTLHISATTLRPISIAGRLACIEEIDPGTQTVIAIRHF
jgi:hypothetical protein